MALHIPSPPASGIHVGPVYVHVYGLMYLVGITLRSRSPASGGGPSAAIPR
jgi:phosphatidylglycerol---prolipoprotein diacylglyceryl transferase